MHAQTLGSNLHDAGSDDDDRRRVCRASERAARARMRDGMGWADGGRARAVGKSHPPHRSAVSTQEDPYLRLRVHGNELARGRRPAGQPSPSPRWSRHQGWDAWPPAGAVPHWPLLADADSGSRAVSRACGASPIIGWENRDRASCSLIICWCWRRRHAWRNLAPGYAGFPASSPR